MLNVSEQANLGTLCVYLSHKFIVEPRCVYHRKIMGASKLRNTRQKHPSSRSRSGWGKHPRLSPAVRRELSQPALAKAGGLGVTPTWPAAGRARPHPRGAVEASQPWPGWSSRAHAEAPESPRRHFRSGTSPSFSHLAKCWCHRNLSPAGMRASRTSSAEATPGHLGPRAQPGRSPPGGAGHHTHGHTRWTAVLWTRR